MTHPPSRPRAALEIALWFLRARRWLHIADPAKLQVHQDRLYRQLQRRVLARSPHYRQMAGLPIASMPPIDREQWMARFEEINTAGVRLDEARRLAEQADRSRDFARRLNGLTVGLSTGTSGKRGIFLLSDGERHRWAGVMLATLLRPATLQRKRIAFFLRANSPLYETVSLGPLQLRYFDLLRPWPSLMEDLARFGAQVIVAPASVLAMIARDAAAGQVRPRQAISVAEVLDPDDRRIILRGLGIDPVEVYQATEGVIALPCSRGRLHLNEAFMHVEIEWIDRESRRFTPVVTDLTRATQPVIRYRLDDIVTLASEPCGCGMAGRTITRIEGRCDDICHLIGRDGNPVPVFPDFLVRAVLAADVGRPDFAILQAVPGQFQVSFDGAPDTAALDRVAGLLRELAQRMHCHAPTLEFSPQLEHQSKRRRVRNLGDASRPRNPAAG